jgi:phosphopantothenoylcysteine decarboxylase/phosphopantothenate--cysteine ligase
MRGNSVLLIIGGGIAAYKSLDLIRRLAERGIGTRAILTRAGAEFVTPLSVSALAGEKVFQDLFSLTDEAEMGHIELSRSTDLVVVAPATADLMAKVANGTANDLASTALLATDKRVLMAPAMNVRMWNHPATQRNFQTLKNEGVLFVGPNDGEMACGEYGPGRMAEPLEIVAAVEAALATPAKGPLSGVKALVTAGPTQEPLDPVRYISNRSSGKMGYALAEAAVARGARVTLISGPVHLAPPRGVTFVGVRTAREMRDQVFANLEPAGIIIKAAAVADFHLAKVPPQKMKKTAARLSLELDPTPDILAELGRKKGDRLLVGFAAETENLQQESRRKLEAKNCDMVVGNLVGGAVGEDTVFDADENEVLLAMRTGEVVAVARASKRAVADRIFDEVLKLRLSLYAIHNGR